MGPLLCVVVCLVACGDDEKAAPDSAGRATFAVVDSLLGEGCELYDADKWIRPPAVFEKAADSILEILKAARAGSAGANADVSLTHCFLDTTAQSGLLITLMRTMNLEADTAGFLARYRSVLHRMYGAEQVTEETHWADSVFIRSFLASDGVIARYQAICLTRRGNGIELNYFAPEGHFAELLPAVTSSLGSLKMLPRDTTGP